MPPALEIQNLVKTYPRRSSGPCLALDGFHMMVEEGQIHGLIGASGSGKTTVFRALLGLVRPDSGHMNLFGCPVPQSLPQMIQHVGAVVGSPKFFPHYLTAWDTLSLLADASAIPRGRVDEVLEHVGLKDRSKDRIETFLSCATQRLAIASALLEQPRLLILDGPITGLNSHDAHEMRDLIRQIAAPSTTIVVSARNANDVEDICDSVTVISKGKRVTDAPAAIPGGKN